MGFNADLLPRLNADVASPHWTGDAGTYTEAATGKAYTSVRIVLTDVTDPLQAAELGPVEQRPLAMIPSQDIDYPQQGDILEVNGKRYTVDVIEREEQMWALTVIPR